MSDWRRTTLGEVMTQVSRAVRVEGLTEARYAGVRWHAGGVYERDTVPAENIKATTLYQIKRDDIVYNRMWATKASFGVVKDDADGCLVTNDFPSFEVNPAVVIPEYVAAIFRTTSFQSEAADRAVGTTERRRLHVRDFASISIVLPPLSTQERIVEVIEAVGDQIVTLEAEADSLDALLRGRKEELFAHYAATGTSLSIGEVLEEVKRPVTVDPNAKYWQIGIKSHGRGLFTKEAVNGESLGSKKVFWVEPGDLVINIVFAWEGAVAIVPGKIKGHCGSHRFPAYRRLDDGDVEFFRLFFSTKRGTLLLGTCSPGGAGRNRTLNRGRLMQSHVGMPSAQEQARAISELQALEAPVVAVRAEAERLRAAHASLLSGLLDCTIGIKPAELEA